MKKPKLDPEEYHKLILEQAHADFVWRYDFRERRRRNRRYLRGDQWSDLIYDKDLGGYITEEEYLQRKGRLTTKNNQLEPIIKNLMGQFRDGRPDPVAFSRNRMDPGIGEMMTEALRYVLDANEAIELDAHTIREHFLSGSVGQRISFGWWSKLNRAEVQLDPVEQSRLGYNSDVSDPRLKDLTRIVYLHDLSIDEVISQFARDEDHAEEIADMYANQTPTVDWTSLNGADRADTIDFYSTYDNAKVRVIEIWRKEHAWLSFLIDHQTGESEVSDLTQDEVAVINGQRVDQAVAMAMVEMDMIGQPYDPATLRQQLIDSGNIKLVEIERRYEEVFHYYYMTPTGQVLLEGETPYWHEEMPFELNLHPMIDGEVYGLLETIIDQQRYINRMISMLDFIITASAKGVLMVPKTVVPKEYLNDLEAYSQKFIEFDGVIYYEPDTTNPNSMPKHITGASLPVGMVEMFQIQQKLLEKISGIMGPVAGETPAAGTPASLYMQQTINAGMTNKDLFSSFYTFLRRRNKKIIQLIQQYWDEPRFFRVSSTGGEEQAKIIEFNPAKVRGVDFDIAMSEGQQSALYKHMIESHLKEFLIAGLMTFEEYLSTSPMPFAATLLEMVRARQAAMAQQGAQTAGPTPGMPETTRMPSGQPSLLEQMDKKAGQGQAAANPASVPKIPQPV